MDAEIHPEIIDKPLRGDILKRLSATSAYFQLSLGGSLVSVDVLKSVRGVAINQHAGWCPDFRGSSAVQTAFYHRRLDQVGAMVHLMTTAADAGPILRRSTITIHPEDTAADCFCAAVSLGTELLLDVISEALSAESLEIYEQPAPPCGQTFRGIDFTELKPQAIDRGLSAGWLRSAIEREQQW